VAAHWQAGFTRAQLEAAEARYGFRFPPDLAELLRDRSPVKGYDWARDDPRIAEMLAWPLETLLRSIVHGWWPGWGERPRDERAAQEVVRDWVARAPKLIPVLGHRFLPAAPDEAGNPVLSIMGIDTIWYGANLDEYFRNEFGGTYVIGEVRTIAYWSDLIDNWGYEPHA
jgi:hypothetical protein